MVCMQVWLAALAACVSSGFAAEKVKVKISTKAKTKHNPFLMHFFNFAYLRL